MRTARAFVTTVALLAAAALPLAAQVQATKTRVGAPGGWRGTVTLLAMNESLWSIENDSTLYRVTPDFTRTMTGGKKGVVWDVAHIVGLDGMFFLLNSHGTLIQVDPNTGDWKGVGSPQAWNGASRLAATEGSLYIVDGRGTLYRAAKNGGKRALGPAGAYRGVQRLFAHGGAVYTVSGDDLWITQIPDGAREQQTQDARFRGVRFMVADETGGYAWAIDQQGTLYRVDQTGTKEVVGTVGAYRNATHLAVVDGAAYTIEGGSLFRTR